MADSTIAQEIQLAGLARRIAQSGTPASITNTTAETTLATITIPANVMGPSGMVEVLPVFSFTGTAGSKNLRVRLNGTQIWLANAATSATFTRPSALTFHNTGSAGAQFAGNAPSLSGVGSGSIDPAVRTTFDSTQALTLTITVTLANAADTAVLEGYLVRVTYGG